MTEFHRVLREMTPDYELLGNTMLSKLLIKEGFTPEDETALEGIRDGLISADSSSIF